MAKTLFLIDGHALVYRAFYAIEGLTAPDGTPTGAVLGFTRMVGNCVKEYNPDYVIAVFDAPGKNFRHEMFTDYKANRKPTPPELIQQIPTIQEVVRLHGYPVVSVSGFEADDLIGTLSRQAEAEGLDVIIITGDKDCGQLVSEHIRLLDPQKGKLTTLESFTEKRGIRPDQLPEVMGLWGDTADNIPGVPGIGEKLGIGLIQEYGTLDNLLDNVDKIKGKRGEVIRQNIEQARLSRELAIIKTDVDVKLDLNAAQRTEPDNNGLIALYEKLGFKQLLHQMGADQPQKKEERDYILVNDTHKFEALITALRHVDCIALDTETTGLDPMQAELVGISLSWAGKTAYYLPFLAPLTDATLGQKELDTIKQFLEDPRLKKVGQNLKYDILVLRNHGIRVQGVVFDTLLAASLLDSGSRANDLDSLAMRHLSIQKIPTSDLIGKGAKQITMAEVPSDKVAEYACEDADVTFRLYHHFSKLIDDAGLSETLQQTEIPLMLLLADMQEAGIRTDTDLLAKQSKELGILLAALTAEIHSLAGIEFNIASPKQLGEVLFERMSLPSLRKTKTGFSTDEETLTELASMGYELPERVLNFRMYSKLKSTYLDALPLMVHPKTGRIHTTLSQTGTATGRLSSSNPNLQNIPVRTQNGKAVRAAFIPQDGWKMLAADYSQIELRMLAHFCEDEVLIGAFKQGMDIHRVVAALINHIEPDAVTSEQRSSAKAVNFGIIYGQTAHGLSRTTGMNRNESQMFIDRYFERFPQVLGFIDQTVEAAREQGYAETMLGRKRYIPELNSNNKAIRSRAEREAVNTLIQGSAADLIKIAMVNLQKRMQLDAPRSTMLLQIHDELVFEMPLEEIDALQQIVRDEMEHAMNLRVPLLVEMGIGNNWLELK